MQPPIPASLPERGRGSSRQLVEHNLLGTFQTLEYCKACKAGLVLLSSSRIYSIRDLDSIPLLEAGNNFVFDESRHILRGYLPWA